MTNEGTENGREWVESNKTVLPMLFWVQRPPQSICFSVGRGVSGESGVEMKMQRIAGTDAPRATLCGLRAARAQTIKY